MQRHLNRRTFGTLIGAAAIASGGRRSWAQSGRFAGQTLRIGTFGGTWADAIREAVGARFAEAGATLEFVTGSPQDNLAKAIAARRHGDPPFDAFEILGATVPQIMALDLLQDIDYDAIPNAKILPEAQRQPKLAAIWATQEMIVYSPQQFHKLGLAAPVSLADLTDPRLAGRVMIPDISSGGGLEAVGAFAITAGDDETNIDPGLELMKRIQGLRLWKAGGEVVTSFKSGDIWAAEAHAGWAIRVNYAGVEVMTAPPKLGANVGLIKDGWIGVARGTKHAALAAFYIDAFLDTATQHLMAVKTGTVPVNPAAWSKLAETPVVKDMMVLDPARIANMRRLDYAKIDLAMWNDRWNRIIAQ
ncbi:MAG TPA: extracellular solute-binding protein [Stellaceae bacterium]|jgi:putative spermidine/putrescine transport system substrate-binding protein|nr:extracellular solute-binding protein [Stellaceae bacterium]